MRVYLVLIFVFCSFLLYGQNNNFETNDSNTISKKQVSQTVNMLKSLSKKGIGLSKDSLFISEEFKRLLNDSIYFKTVYPDQYTWEQTIYYIKTKELKKAFWYLINLYPLNDQNKELVIKSVISYDDLLKMDNVLINTFYTYAFADPEVSKIIDHTPEITRPDVLEKKLNTVKELIQYIYKYREQKDMSK